MTVSKKALRYSRDGIHCKIDNGSSEEYNDSLKKIITKICVFGTCQGRSSGDKEKRENNKKRGKK